jgi:hypothetical protein
MTTTMNTIYEVNGREYRSANKNRTMQRNWKHKVHEEKQTRNITQYVLDTNVQKQTQIT